MAEAKKVTKEVMVEKFNYGGKEYKRGERVELSEANAEIFKQKLCEPGKAPAQTGGKKVKELESEVAKLKDQVKNLTNQNAALTQQLTAAKAAR